MDFDTEFEKLKRVMEIEPEKESLSLENFIREYMERLGVILTLSPSGMRVEVVSALILNLWGEFCGAIE